MTPNPLLTPEEAQRLGRARVGIAGAGGLGSNIAMHLTRAGVGHLTVVDFDVVSESNLNRQFYFRDQVGLPKVAALCTNLLRIAPALDLRTHAQRLTEADFRPTFADCEVVVEAFDNPEAKAAFLRALLPTGKPLVCASAPPSTWPAMPPLQPRPPVHRPPHASVSSPRSRPTPSLPYC